jgi:anti-sigma factor RsiW
MSCPKSILISAYLDDELRVVDKAALEAHLPVCGACSTALREMRSLRAAFANVDRHQAPYGFATRVMARAAEPEKNRATWIVPFPVRFVEAAVLLAVITVGILAGRIMTDSSVTPDPANITASFSLDLFDAAPPGSPAGAYLAMTEAEHEK